MNLWSWGSPVAWAIFLVGCGVTVALMSWGLRWVAYAIRDLATLPVNRRR